MQTLSLQTRTMLPRALCHILRLLFFIPLVSTFTLSYPTEDVTTDYNFTELPSNESDVTTTASIPTTDPTTIPILRTVNFTTKTSIPTTTAPISTADPTSFTSADPTTVLPSADPTGPLPLPSMDMWAPGTVYTLAFHVTLGICGVISLVLILVLTGAILYTKYQAYMARIGPKSYSYTTSDGRAYVTGNTI